MPIIMAMTLLRWAGQIFAGLLLADSQFLGEGVKLRPFLRINEVISR